MERVRAYPWLALAIYAALAAAWIGMSRDLIDREGKPLGADFITFYAASELSLQGRLAEAYDPQSILAAERAAVPANTETFPWLYPPSFALAVLPLALMPYVLALVVFLGVTFALYLWLIHRILPDRRAVVAALAFSGAFVNAMSGQNGFLTAALLGGGLLLLESRPVLAGALIGLLTVKPHLGLLLPFALALGGQWRAILAAAVAALLLAGAALLAFGAEPWRLFLAHLAAGGGYMESGALPWDKMVSVFAAARLLGLGIGPAYALHGIVAAVVAVLTLRLWWRGGEPRLLAALTAAATPLLPPYFYDYDLVLTAVPIAILAADGLNRGWVPGVRTVLVLAWIAPLLATVLARFAGVPLMPLALLALFAMTLKCAATTPPRRS